MVYISHPTEYGTLYTKGELAELSAVCSEYRIPLYLDGARLGYALAAAGTDVTLQDVAEYCDVFYIGGTKVGALCGEAVVFPKENTPIHFVTKVKQRGLNQFTVNGGINMSSTIQVRVDDELKAKSDSLFKDLGTDTTTAIRIFLTQAVAYNGFPFEIRRNSTVNSPYTPMSEESMLKKLDESKKYADQGQCRRADDVVADMRTKYGL